ncbi:MAG: transcription antitermination factor NusB [Eubacteriales bacterium]|jgi:N utilization substance protein B|nr:transcription antitermination factor NusB [Eubacteriales bacterium]
MTRKKARDLTFKLIYQTDMQNEVPENIMDVFLLENNISEEATEYVNDVLFGVFKNKDFIDSTISKFLEGWRFERVARISLNALRLSIYEIFYRDDIPAGVSINEAVDIVKTYLTDEDASFVNGVLSSILKSKQKGK